MSSSANIRAATLPVGTTVRHVTVADSSLTTAVPTTAAVGPPRRVVVALLDSLNRHLLAAYGGDEFDTPNLDRVASSSVVFDRHVVGSLPCMPARHDLLVGSLDFLWRPWGSIEIWEEAITTELRRRGVPSVLVSDHPHLFETGGENYHCDFEAWDYVRGHENDPWRTRPDPSWVGTPALPAAVAPGRRHRYDESRTWFRDEADFPGPRTMRAAADWLRRDAPHHDEFLLVIDEFDPHEPFDTPEPWASRYDPDWTGERLIWPPYAVDAIARGVLTEREAAHVRANYGAKLSMIDHWLGEVLDAVDALGDDVVLVLCTDHGHYLGEHDTFGKPGAPVWNALGHLPLMVRWPGVAPHRCAALTTTVDLHATLCDVFDVSPSHRTHGRSLRPLLEGTADSIRDHALGGYWGRHVYVTDSARRYGRSATGDAFPLAMWSNRWSTMPVWHAAGDLRLPAPDHRATLDSMPGSSVPVIRQPFAPGDAIPFWALGAPVDDHHLYALDDAAEVDNQSGSSAERDAIDLLRHALDEIDAPQEQYERLGLRRAAARRHSTSRP
jgi:arylsulfatase A-like enzyme